MKEKKKEGAGGRPRGSRKNIVGSESQGLLQAAAGTGFIGFSAFQTPAKASPPPADVEGGGGAGSTPAGKTGAGSGHGGKRRVKTAKAHGGYSAGPPGQVLPPHYSGSNSHLAVVSKRLSKRDVTTKLKALAELRAMCRLVTREADPAASPQPAPGQDGRAGTSRASSGVAPASGAVAVESSAMDAPSTSAEDLGGLAPHWVFLYQRLSAEGDRRTREAANTTLLCMLKANRRAFQPLMSSLMGPWFCSQADTAPEVCSSAKEAFEAVFPEAKRASVLRRCAEGVLSYIDATVQQTPEMLEEASGCTTEEAVKRAERLSVSALAALSSFLEAVGPEANSALSRRPTDREAVAGEEHDDVARSRQETTYFSLVNESLWARLGDPRTAVRRAMYALVSACCRHAPGLLRPHPPLPAAKASSGDPTEEGATEAAVFDTGGKKEKEKRRDGGGVGGKRSRVATPGLLVELLSEKEDSNHREAWQAVLLVLTEFKETWMAEKGATAVLPTLLTRLRKGAFLATSGTSYPCLLPLLASLPAQALLLPADNRAGPPFCVALVENLWATIAEPSSGDAAGDRTGGGGGWLADVVSAHVECVTFLLLKLPPASQGLGEEDDSTASASGDRPDDVGGGRVVDTERHPAAVSAAAATTNLAKAVGVFVLEEETGASGLGNGLRTVGRRSQTISEAFGRALGQLHLGGEKGAGVMGSTSGSAAVWGALLREFQGALDQRSRGGAAWMGKTLVRALAAVNERKSGEARGSPGAAAVSDETSQPSTAARGPHGAGLRELCRALFHHCVGAIGYVGPSSGVADDEGRGAISSVDAPLTTFMSSMAGALGKDGIFRMRDVALSSDGGGGDSEPSVVAPDSAREFYENFLVPRFVASAGGSRSMETMREAAMALESLAKAFLLAQDGPIQSDDFRLLLRRALAEPEPVWLRTTTIVLRLAPASMARVFPEVDEALLRACGISLPGTEPAAAPPSSSSSSPTRLHPKSSTQDLPAFLQACLGVTDDRREGTAAPFVKASTVSEVVKVATVASLSASTSNSAGTAKAAGAAIRPTLLSMAVLEGLLGVLGLTGETGEPLDIGTGGVGNEGDALATVRRSGLSLLLAAFSAIGEGRAADRLWRDVAAPTLQDLVLRGPRRAAAAAEWPPQWFDGIWQEFLGGAVEEARRAMEGGGGGVHDDGASDQGTPPLLLPGRGGVERAATLASALLELRSALVRRGAALLPPQDDAPVLWRLGLTRPSVWRQRRLEALAAAGAAQSTAPPLATAAADLARACVGSRWARRWECVSLVLAQLPDARTRLSLLVEGVVSTEAEGGGVGVAGEALHEILAAGVMVSRAVRLLRGEEEGHGGVAEVSVDLPSCLLVAPPANDAISASGRIPRAAGGVDSVEEFGVGLPRFRGISMAAMAADGDDPAAVAAVASAEVLDAALAHLGEQSQGVFEAKAGAAAAGGDGVPSKQQQQQHPFSLLLPQGLWRVAFESAAPDANDERLHAVLLSALSSCLALAAQDAAALAGGGGGGEAGAAAWRTSCSAMVSSGLVVAVVGEAFARGLGLGDEANRLMAVRCGIYKAPVPSAADLVPGAKTLYTSDGQAVTIVAAHVDPGGGEGYYTVRPLPAPGGTAEDTSRERQTVLGRLSVTPPSPPSSGGVAAPPTHTRWLVRPAVAAKLGEVLAGPVSAIERRLWEHLGRSPEISGPEAPAPSSATAAALRGVASTCVRAALLCGSNPDGTAGRGGQEAWEGVRPGILTLRNRWAAAAAKSGSAVLASRTGSGSGGTVQAAATVALAASVLSGFLAATPLMPSDEEGMRLMPARLRGALCDEAAGGGGSGAALGWRRAQGTASLAWLRDCAEASCKVHVSPSPGSLGSEIFVGTHKETEAAVVALVRSAGRRRRGDSVVRGGGSFDLALARACAGLFAAESYRLSRGHAASLSCESKAAVVSWAVSKFLLSGGRMATATAPGEGLVSFGGGGDDDAALCLETARLLTATAWDGRVGWGGGAAAAGGAALPPPLHRLLAARGDRAKVWEAARSPAVWRGLHAAVVGAVASPVLQLCAFEVLEAAAADWRSDAASGDEGPEGAKGEDAGTPGEEEESKGDSRATAAAPGEGPSIVSRLARALGGWGLASAPAGGGAGGAVDVEGSGEGGDADEGGGGEGSLPGTEAVEEEAKEQQDDLELIAKCFPEDLLLAVEALPSTIDALAEAPQASARARGGARGEDDMMSVHEEEEEDYDDDSESEEEDPEDAQQAWDSEEGADVDSAERPTSDASPEEEEDGSENGGAEEEHSADSEPEHGGDSAPQSTASKSRRKRLRRRLSGSGTTRTTTSDRGQAGSIPGGGRDRRRNPASGPSLTGPFLTWLLWLEHCRRASELEVKSRSAARTFVTRAGALAPVMEACFRVLRASQDDGGRGNSGSIGGASRLGPAQAVRVSRLDPSKPHDLARLALAVYFRTVHVFPALSRAWWSDDCTRGLRVWVADFTKRHVSPALIQMEAQIITKATDKGVWDDGGEMSVRASANSRQVVASYLKEECTLEAVIQLPPDYPLRNVEVTCSKRMGVSESRWRQWVLQIVTLLSLQDGSVLDAVMMWKKNVDKEFEGVEPCVICYSVLHPKSMDLPQMTCKTCNNRFHSSCLYKWFHTSHKNKCPICQQTWA